MNTPTFRPLILALLLWAFATVSVFAADQGPQRHWLARVKDTSCVGHLTNERLAFRHKLSYLKPLFDELNADPLTALGCGHLQASPRAVPAVYNVPPSTVGSAHTLIGAGEFASVYRTTHNGGRAAVRLAYNPLRHALRTAGTHAIMAQLGLAPTFYGILVGPLLDRGLRANKAIDRQLHAHASWPVLAMVMEEVTAPRNLLHLDTYYRRTTKEQIGIKVFFERVLETLTVFQITPALDFQALYSEDEGRPYLIDFDLYKPVTVEASTAEPLVYTPRWLNNYISYTEEMFPGL